MGDIRSICASLVLKMHSAHDSLKGMQMFRRTLLQTFFALNRFNSSNEYIMSSQATAWVKK